MTSDSSRPSMKRPCMLGLIWRDHVLGDSALEACGLDGTMYTTFHECMDKMTCKGGSLYLDVQSTRFVADLPHPPLSTHLFGQPYHWNSYSKSFDTHFDGDWEQALKSCHFWMWTKYAKLNPDNASCQTPGQVPEGMFNVLGPFIKAMEKGMWFRQLPPSTTDKFGDLADMNLDQVLLWLGEKERQAQPPQPFQFSLNEPP